MKKALTILAFLPLALQAKYDYLSDSQLPQTREKGNTERRSRRAIEMQKPRILVTTDIGGDPDDHQALIRLMVYSNEFEIEGLVSSAAGTPGELKEKIVYPDKIRQIIRGYEEVYPNLLKHDKGFPNPEKLYRVIKSGNPHRGWDQVGEGKDTEGSEWIIAMADKKDKRPLNICIFGGQTDVAQALWKVKSTRSEKSYKQFLSRIRIYDIDDQDGIFSQLIESHPDVFYILSKSAPGEDKRKGTYRGMYLGGDESLTSREWLKEYVTEKHGPLGQLYPTQTWTAPNPYGALKEGDVPSWFYFLENGLHYPAAPEFGGWGGRYRRHEKGYYHDLSADMSEDNDPRATVYRWRDDFQREFAARMDWCVQEFANANHAPVVALNGSSEKAQAFIRKKAGKQVDLDAASSTDPDDDNLHFDWFFYPEAGNHKGEWPEVKKDGAKVSFTMPALPSGSALHLILKVTDTGQPALTSYRRIVLTN